jgi:hypothetical protein
MNVEINAISQARSFLTYIEIIAVDSILQIVGDTSGFFQTTITLIVVWPLQKQNCKNRTFIGTCIRYFKNIQFKPDSKIIILERSLWLHPALF